MKGYVFDPSRLACSPKEQERQGYAIAGPMLCGYLGGAEALPVRPVLRRFTGPLAGPAQPCQPRIGRTITTSPGAGPKAR